MRRFSSLSSLYDALRTLGRRGHSRYAPASTDRAKVEGRTLGRQAPRASPLLGKGIDEEGDMCLVGLLILMSQLGVRVQSTLPHVVRNVSSGNHGIQGSSRLNAPTLRSIEE